MPNKDLTKATERLSAALATLEQEINDSRALAANFQAAAATLGKENAELKHKLSTCLTRLDMLTLKVNALLALTTGEGL
jgi:chromosome segregation ATPase